MQVFNCEQGTDEWRLLRIGIPTASEFKTLLGVKKDARDKATREKYMLRLAGEIITGMPEDGYSNGHMDRGKEMEVDARNFYSFVSPDELTQVGFIRNRGAGCSPDSLVGANGALEIKTALPSILGGLIRKKEFPPGHKAQCQGVLWLAEREWIDLLVFWPRMPAFCKRAYRDDAYIKELAAAVDRFNEEMAIAVDEIRAST